ncbi:T9SS type A sorting domain-containing protein [bacterium]|nr:T9SS type A sorting domain-containing protein [bacterium]
MPKYVIAILALALNFQAAELLAQSYTSYFTGTPFNSNTQPSGGVCMMGGATEHDEAMRWFLNRANGGDILVLRASGSDGYNNYLYSELGVTVNSVETIVFNNATAANEPYIHARINAVEGIWFAGGDQWDYVSYWRGTPIDSLVNVALHDRHIVIGGTSAGMAILGGFYFTSQNGTVTSEEALADPYNPLITVDSTHFLEVNYLDHVVTDTHYDDRGRRGRHVAFMARVLTDYGANPKGIACNEYTAVCIDENGLARVYGDYPNYPEATYFLQTNCELEEFHPEVCSAGQPLEWNLAGAAIRVCKVWGTNNGVNTFNLLDWETDNGGIWENWSVSNGALVSAAGVQIDCDAGSSVEPSVDQAVEFRLLEAYPNPFNSSTTIQFDLAREASVTLKVFDVQGRLVSTLIDDQTLSAGVHTQLFDASSFSSGVYFYRLETATHLQTMKMVLMR